MSAAKKKRDGDDISFSEFFRLLRDERGRQNARMKARIKARIEALMAPRPGTIAEAERRLAEIEHLQQLLNELGQFRQGRPESAMTAHIRELAAAHPTVKPTPLYKLRDRSIIKSMNPGSWRTRVAEARRK